MDDVSPLSSTSWPEPLTQKGVFKKQQGVFKKQQGVFKITPLADVPAGQYYRPLPRGASNRHQMVHMRLSADWLFGDGTSITAVKNSATAAAVECTGVIVMSDDPMMRHKQIGQITCYQLTEQVQWVDGRGLPIYEFVPAP